MYRSIATLAAGIALAAAPAAAHAQDFRDWLYTDLYIGFSTSAGTHSSDVSAERFVASLTEADVIHEVRADDGGVGWRMYAGKRLHPNFMLEAGYVKTGKIRVGVRAEAGDRDAFLEQLARETPVAPGGITIDAVSEWFLADLGVRASWAQQTYLVGRLGMLAWRTEASYVDGASIISHSDAGVGLHAGIGGGWWFSERFATRLEWEQYSAPTRMKAVSLGIVYSF